MKTNIHLKSFLRSGIAILLVAALFILFARIETGIFQRPDKRQKYERFLKEHPYSHPLRVSKKDLKKIPKKDRPDLAMQQNFLMTLDPTLGYPPTQRLVPVFKQVQTFKTQVQILGLVDPSTPWVERGPSNVGGRTRALMFDPNDVTVKKVWAAGVGGGIWYTDDITDVNETWNNVDDFMANIAVTAIAYDPVNTLVFYAGTGEGFFNADAIRGAGIWKSTDGGTSWAQLASTIVPGFAYIQKIVVHPVTSDIYAATRASSGSTSGIMRSQDGGTSWTKVLGSGVGASTNSAADLEIGVDNTIYAAFGIFSTDGVYSSTTGNISSWTKLNSSSNGFPTTGIQRIEIATAPSDANVIYAITQNASTSGIEGLYRSGDKGANWSSLALPNDADTGIPASDYSRGQAWYDLSAGVDPNNENTVFVGGIDLFKSTNGGTSWTQISHWFGGFGFPNVHADQHNIMFKPGSSSEIVFSHDGGVDYTANGTSSTPLFINRNNNYNVTQFYACAIHPTAGTNYFLAGAQDNGSQQFNSEGIDATVEVTGGDGCFTFIDQTDPTYQITSFIFNNFFRSTNSGVSFFDITSGRDNTGKFVNPADYDDVLDILYSARDASTLKRITGISGTRVEGVVTVPGGLGATASHVRVSPYTVGSTTLFIGTGSGRVFKITNADGGAPASTEITGGSFPTGNISCIEIGVSEMELLVTFSNFGVTSVWYTSNGGTSWSNKEGNLSDMPVRWALFNPGNSNEVILATEVGVWSTTNLNSGSPIWSPSNSGLANVRVDMLQIRSSDNAVIAATHGRGLFSGAFLDGTLTLTENSGDQATNVFNGSASVSSAQLFHFGFTANTENYDVATGLTLGAATTGIVSGDFANLILIQDTNNNGTIDGGETSVGTIESPLDINDGITFSSFTIPQGTPGYILTGDVNNLAGGNQLIVSLSTANITNVTGATSGSPITPAGSVSSTIHTAPPEALIWNPTAAAVASNVVKPALKKKGMAISPATTQKSLELTVASAGDLATALSALSISNTTVTDLSTVSLPVFKYVFVVLGQFNSNHVVPSGGADATALESYLAGGGKLYMEGGDVWFFDPASAGGHDFGPTFGITGLSDGASGNEFSTISGSDFVAGQDFTYAGGGNFSDHLSAIGTGVVVHSNTSPAFDCGVANINAGTSARTIGTSFEFGQLTDGASPATKTELMQTYIDFFDDGGIVTGIVFRVERATGDVFASSYTGGGADLAERIKVSEPVEFGDVVELDPNKPEYYRKTRGSSQLIAGVITTEPGFTLGNNLEETAAAPLIANAETVPLTTTSRPMLTLMGRVPVKVTTENGTIQPGDLLTIASKPGYAMRSSASQKSESAIIGKALEGLKKGEGTILVLVMAH